MYNRIIENETYKKAMAYIEKIESERIFCRHGIDHCLDVARTGYILALENNINVSKELIYSAALLHDIGRSVSQDNHDIEGVRIAEKILNECDFSSENTTLILEAIASHRGDLKNIETLSDIITFADKISRCCWCCKAYDKCYWKEERKNKKVII